MKRETQVFVYWSPCSTLDRQPNRAKNMTGDDVKVQCHVVISKHKLILNLLPRSETKESAQG